MKHREQGSVYFCCVTPVDQAGNNLGQVPTMLFLVSAGLQKCTKSHGIEDRAQGTGNSSWVIGI